MDILVFKTNIRPPVTDEINKHLSGIQGIGAWSFDLEDIDRILRVQTIHASAREIEQVLGGAGYECRELE